MNVYAYIFLSEDLCLFCGRTRSKVYLQLCQIIWGLVWVKITPPVEFLQTLQKRLVSPNNQNKYQLTLNFQGNFVFWMRIDSISESTKMIFNQFLLPWCHFMLFKSKINFCEAMTATIKEWKIHSLFVDPLPRIIYLCSKKKTSCLAMKYEHNKYVKNK